MYGWGWSDLCIYTGILYYLFCRLLCLTFAVLLLYTDKINKRKKEVDSFLEAADTVKSDNSKGVDDRDDPVGAGVEEGGRGKGGSENGDVSD